MKWWGILGPSQNHIFGIYATSREERHTGPKKSCKVVSVVISEEVLRAGLEQWPGTCGRPSLDSVRGWELFLALPWAWPLSSSAETWFLKHCQPGLPCEHRGQHSIRDQGLSPCAVSIFCRSRMDRPGGSFFLSLFYPLISGMHREPLWFGCGSWISTVKWSQAVCLF